MEVLGINSNSLTSPFRRNTFKLKELQIKMEDDLLVIRMKANALKNNPFLMHIEDGILTTSLVSPSFEFKGRKIIQKLTFQDFFLTLPNKTHRHIVATKKNDGTVEVFISKYKDYNGVSHLELTNVA